VTSVLVVCTANQCRSPMAHVLLARRLPGLEVHSAGRLPGGVPASGGSVRVMAARGLALDDHVSRTHDAELIGAADLVVCMARVHVREVVVTVPAAFRKTFTLRELVRRGEAAGPAASFDEWLALVGAGRRPADLVGDDPGDDVEDPMGRPDEEYEKTAVQLEVLVDRLGALLEPYA
jgi:protein-tyrosine phosphatase